MFKRTAVAALVLSAMAGVIGSAHAASGETIVSGKLAIPPVLKMAQEQGGIQVIKDFKAAGGMQGWVVKDKGNQTTVVFTSKDGEVLMAGMMLDKDGRNLTQLYASEHLPKPDYSPAYKAFAPGGEATGVMVGDTKAVAEITVLFDANCGYCKLMHKMVQPAIEAGELRVHYVPVGILSADSAGKAAGILAAKDAKLDLDTIAAGGNAEQSTDKVLAAKVQANNDLMRKHGLNGTPVVLYKVKSGKDETLMVSPGMPDIKNMFKVLGISGQVHKLQADPALAKHLR